MHICTVTVAIVHKCTIMHKLVWVFFCSNCVKLTTFFILHNYAQADVIALRDFFGPLGFAGEGFDFWLLALVLAVKGCGSPRVKSVEEEG